MAIVDVDVVRLGLHSSCEPGKLSQWLCNDDSTTNIDICIIISHIAIQSIACKRVLVWVLSPVPSVGLCLCLSPGRSVRGMDYGKKADWIWMPFGMVV